MPHEIDAELIERGEMEINEALGRCGLCEGWVYEHDSANDTQAEIEYGHAHNFCWDAELDRRAYDAYRFGSQMPSELYD